MLWYGDYILFVQGVFKVIFKENIKNSIYVKDHFCCILNTTIVVPEYFEMQSLHEVFFITGNK